jgi:hypothetical protein
MHVLRAREHARRLLEGAIGIQKADRSFGTTAAGRISDLTFIFSPAVMAAHSLHPISYGGVREMAGSTNATRL